MKKYFILSVLCVFALSGQAQLVYDNDVLLFRNVDRYNEYSSTWGGWAHCWTHQGKQFKINLAPADVRIAGSTGKLVFYDTENLGFIDIQCRTVYNSSDLSSKTNIQPFSNPIQKVLALKPVSYQWKDQAEYSKFTRKAAGANSSREIGFIAQDVEKVLPEVVTIDSEGNKLINYMGIIPILTGAIQELNAKVVALEEELQALKNGN